MSLKDSLEQYKYELASSLPTEVLEVLSRNTSLLQERKMAQQALQVGDTFPDHNGPDPSLKTSLALKINQVVEHFDKTIDHYIFGKMLISYVLSAYP